MKTAKEYLKQYGEAEKIAARIKAEYDKELEMIDSIKSPMDTDGMPHGTGVSRIVEQRAVRLAEKAEAYKVAAIDALKIRQDVFDVILKVDGVQGQILYERYINLKKWDQIADELHYTVRWVQYLHGEALKFITLHCTSLFDVIL